MSTALSRAIVVSAALALLLAAAPEAGAWGDQGHRIVARVADHYLSPEAKAAVVSILGQDAYFAVCAQQGLAVRTGADKLACVATWADAVRNTAAYRSTAALHFVDIPIGATPPAYDAARDCAHGCVVEAIETYRTILADPHHAKRGEALKFLIHLVGDLHQPLHAAFDADRDAGKPANAGKSWPHKGEGDRGGNMKLVTWLGDDGTQFGCWNLHSVWDSGIVAETRLDEGAYTRALVAALTPARQAALRQGNPAAWANEALAVAIRQAYGTLPAPDGNDRACEISDQDGKTCALDAGQSCAAAEVHDRYHLGRAYYEANRPSVDAQLSAAGVRLARLLNETLK